jgi:hypothetical protein
MKYAKLIVAHMYSTEKTCNRKQEKKVI